MLDNLLKDSVGRVGFDHAIGAVSGEGAAHAVVGALYQVTAFVPAVVGAGIVHHQVYMDPSLQELFQSDVESLRTRENLLGITKNVREGRNSLLEFTGNAFNVRIAQSGVTVEHLWDDSFVPVEIRVEDFLAAVQGWNPLSP